VALDTHRVGGDISVTQLIDGPRIRILKGKHDYESDVVDNLYALMGTALHNILERANIKSVRKRAFILTAETIITEADRLAKDTTNPDAVKRAAQLKAAANYIFSLIPVFFPEIGSRYIFELTLRLEVGDIVLYGTFDVYDQETGILYDYKFTSVYAWTYPESRKKWERQTNIYATMLINTKGLSVNGIRIVAFFRDWNEYSLNRSKDYPQRQIMEIDVPVYSEERVMTYINARLDIHRRAMAGEDIDCTGDERWGKATMYAVKTPKSKKAVRVFDSEPASIAFLQENQHKYDNAFIEKRPGDSMRCAKYCSVAPFCSQRKKELEMQALEK